MAWAAPAAQARGAGRRRKVGLDLPLDRTERPPQGLAACKNSGLKRHQTTGQLKEPLPCSAPRGMFHTAPLTGREWPDR